MEDSSTTKLIVTYNGCATQQGFSEYLEEKLPQSMRKFTVTIVGQPSMDCTEFEVEFTSKTIDRLALSRIQNVIITLTNLSIQSEIDDFKLSLQRKLGLLLVHNDDNMFSLKEELRKLEVIPKRCSLQQHKQILQEQKIVSQQIEEHSLQQKEFTDYCTELLIKLESIATSSQVDTKLLKEQFEKIKAKFGMECHRFSKPLPMYARRQQILTTITNHQVTILIGETGSGKSTQLVQYLHDAEILSDGIIVCTQPRKVAAVSLANFVSREMCVRVGEELGYKVGMLGKCSENTKVLYMTDHALLNECIKDQTFSKYSCVVIDEAHERSLHTDLLLSLVKSCLHHRKDLRVVITSATIDPVVFLKYFGNCPVIRVPGRAYPVETIWKPVPTVGGLPTSEEMIFAAIKVVDTIHSAEEPGDVLVFITSPHEVELACQRMSDMVDNESAIVLPLHGKLQPQDQQKVFHRYEGKRKVVFSTNVAETSVTIDGVKFVVDTGMAKELHFDPKRNMNALEVCWISKTSAEQRKGRAGRTCPGKCFRLYSAETHTEMRDRMLPELLRVQLSHAVLKLYEFGIKDVLQFDFVEQPDAITLKEAVEMLKFVEAIDDRGLTAKGKTLATLPIDPQLGKVLLDGCDDGIGLEAAVAVAMSATGGGVFFRAGTDAEKEASDKKKLQFCHEGGDQLTNLCVYWKWSSQDANKRNKWCYENSINAKSMRRVEEMVKELQKILLTHKIKIAASLKDLKNAALFFPKLFFYAFLPNLAVFIGHERAGYIVTETQIGSFFMFPGSVLVSQNLCPKVLVYEKTLKTSHQFLLQLMPVKQEWIEEAVSTGKLPLHPVERFKDYMVSAVSLSLVGWQVFKKGYIDDDQVKSQLKETCQDTPHSIDSSKAKVCGKIEIYSQSRYHQQAKELFEQKFNAIKKEFMKEQCEIGITAETDDVHLVLGNGGLIQHVLMLEECRTIVIKGPVNVKWTSNAMKQVKILGEISSTSSRSFKKEHRLYVTYSNPMNAATALIALAGQDERLSVELSKKTHGKSVCYYAKG
ncbi:ATP-dependent RNA helicase DHX15 homolog [Dysidea avara]|uniref:ATP-dependent RNA helicase DHX15 homolog n=1 Tax=Dysidea avara TaxID=196820 RepID=UPI003320C714